MSSPSPLIAKIVQAGAGAGKTQSLALEILNNAVKLKTKNGKWPRLVASTFTERATAELRERVVQLSSDFEYSSSDGDFSLQDYAQDTDLLQISTLHGLFSKFLHHYGALNGLDPDFQILTEQENHQLYSQALRKWLAAENQSETLIDIYGFEEVLSLVKVFIEAKKSNGEKFLPLLHWEKLKEKHLKEAHLVISRVVELERRSGLIKLPPKLSEAKDKIISLWSSGEYSKLSWDQARSTLLSALSDFRAPSGSQKSEQEEWREAIKAVFEIKKLWQQEAFDELTNKIFEAQSSLWLSLVESVEESVKKIKFEIGALSFSDLEFEIKNLIERHPVVASKIRNTIDYWFIDEFQDTSPLQKTILTSLFRNPWNVYFVGDPQQSIYLFRGADTEVFKNTQNEVEIKGGVKLNLNKNFRSEPDLLKFMNILFPQMEARGAEKGEVLTQIHLTEKDQEYSAIKLQIQEWLDGGFELHDIALLVRTNREGKLLATELSACGWPVFLHTSGGFYDQREVEDALSVLQILIDPADRENTVMFLRSPWAGLSDEIIVEWAQSTKAESGIESLTPLIPKMNEWTQYVLVKIKEALKRLDSTPLSSVFEDLLFDLGFLELSFVEDLSGKREANLRKLVASLRRAELKPGFMASEFIHRAWQEADDAGDGESEAPSFIEPKRINILTIHKSKGLKFNAVIIPSCGAEYKIRPQKVEISPEGKWAVSVLSSEIEEKISPLALLELRAQREARERDEFQRLFYVGVTRAAKALALIAKKDFGKSSWLGAQAEKIILDPGTYQQCYRVRVHDEETQKIKKENESSLSLSTENYFNPVYVKAKSPPQALENPSFESINALLESQGIGLAIHRLFELLKSASSALNWDETISWAYGNYLEILKKEGLGNLEFSFSDFKNVLSIQDPPLKEIVQNGFSEWNFTFSMNGKDFSGRVDLWGHAHDCFWIIDFKSAPRLSASLLEKAKSQIEFYALALHLTGVPWEKIKGAVVLPQNIQESSHVSLGEKEDVISRLQKSRLTPLSPLDQI